MKYNPTPEARAIKQKQDRERIASRRSKWLEDKNCVNCGSCERLEIDHIDPSTKISSTVWTWTEKRRKVELEKCQVLCRPCHVEKSFKEGSMVPFDRGEKNISAKLTEDQVRLIRKFVNIGMMQKDIAEYLNIPKQTINNIVKGHSWKWLLDDNL